jgi:pyruvate/2-oxoglutarate/acetoin dehydrogenase E1 component
MEERIIKYAEAIKEATQQILESDPKSFIMGLGVPQGAAGTVVGLKDLFPTRVLDTPTSEAALTGLAVGAAISGLHPMVYHERVEFSLLASDQIFTQAAKWNYMFGGGNPVPLVLRIAIGRQWGNGPQHSQALYSLFGAVRGLKVVIPSTPEMMKGLLIAAIRDPNPVIILEPRWLYQVKQHVPTEMFEVPLDKARIVKPGKDITVVAYGDAFVDSLEALKLLPQDIDVELIDLVSINPVDYETITNSVAKTGRLLTVDSTNGAFSIGSEIIAKVAQNPIGLMYKPEAVAAPDVPVPTSPALSEFWYPNKIDIANKILKMFEKPTLDKTLSFEELHLAPGMTIAKLHPNEQIIHAPSISGKK